MVDWVLNTLLLNEHNLKELSLGRSQVDLRPWHTCMMESFVNIVNILTLSCGRGFYHIETSPLINSANQWTVFYMIGTSIMKELAVKVIFIKSPTWMFGKVLSTLLKVFKYGPYFKITFVRWSLLVNLYQLFLANFLYIWYSKYMCRLLFKFYKIL